MEPTTTIPTPPATATATSYHHLEINLISAQDLSLSAKSMKTYAMAYLHPNRKLSTLVDTKGNTNPTWNEKLMFKIDDQFLFSSDQSSSLTIEIYNVSWFRDVLIGSVNVLIDDLITPEHKHHRAGSRFVTLQIRRPSGTPQGILNIGYTLGNANEQGVPLYSEFSSEKKPEKETAGDLGDGNLHVHEKIHLWRSRSVDELDDEDDYPGSVYDGSMVNGSDICSDVGPSASIVAAEIAQKSQPPLSPRPPPTARRPIMRNVDDGGSSILGELTYEEALAKGWLVDFPANNNKVVARRRNNHARRHSDGGGLFSCFALGIEFHIVCGSGGNNKQSSSNAKKNRARNRKGSG